MNRTARCSIVGIGESAVGKVPDRSALQLQADATGAAMIHHAAIAIAAGQCTTVLCVAGQNLLSGGHRGLGGGFFHVLEAVRQIRGSAGARQVENAGTVLVHGNGGTIAIHCTLILGNEAAA